LVHHQLIPSESDADITEVTDYMHTSPTRHNESTIK